MSKEKLEPITKEWYDQMKARLEAAGYGVKNKWRKGTVQLHIGVLVPKRKPTTKSERGRENE